LPNGSGKAVFRVFDHCTIYLLIAGTYTPYCLIALGGTTVGTVILICEWALAIGGIIMNSIAMNNKIIKGISMGLYVIMGWMIVISFKRLLAFLSPASFWLLLLGGVAYTMGIAFYAFGKKVKYFHSIWHLFDLLGTALQFVSILLMVI
jgi:hemolysin III